MELEKQTQREVSELRNNLREKSEPLHYRDTFEVTNNNTIKRRCNQKRILWLHCCHE